MSLEALIAAFAAVVVSFLISMLAWERRLDDQRREFGDRVRHLDGKISRLEEEVARLRRELWRVEGGPREEAGRARGSVR